MSLPLVPIDAARTHTQKKRGRGREENGEERNEKRETKRIEMNRNGRLRNVTDRLEHEDFASSCPCYRN